MTTNILILAAGNSNFGAHDENYPLCLAELNGKPLIELLIESCGALEPVNFIVALREEDIRRYHLDSVVQLLAPNVKVLRVGANTRGAACTALLAAGYIDGHDELLILNGNELLDIDFSAVLGDFRSRELAAGVVTFPSVHPRYSYVRVDKKGLVVEAAEKKPISRLATAGFYWFAHGRDFVRAVKNMIRKDASVDGVFYICPAMNELVLEQARISVHNIDAGHYHPLKTEYQLEQYDTSKTQRKFA